MAGVLSLVLQALPGGPVGALTAAGQLAAALPTGALTFIASVYALWRVVGRPSGPEEKLIALVRERLARAPTTS